MTLIGSCVIVGEGRGGGDRRGEEGREWEGLVLIGSRFIGDWKRRILIGFRIAGGLEKTNSDWFGFLVDGDWI